MEEILLTQGKIALVSKEDYELLSKYKWNAIRKTHSDEFYARRCLYDPVSKKSLAIYMHREILGAEKGEEVDHINRDTLDNRRENLRTCTRVQNMGNIKGRSSTGFKGLTFNKVSQLFQAQIMKKGKNINLGSFIDKKEAAKVYNKAATSYFREFAVLNPI